MSAATNEQQSVNMLVAARWWASRGVPVFPLHHPVGADDALVCSCRRKDCHSPAKHPLTANGLEDATTDLEQVDRWWRQYPQANIGLRTGVAFDLLDIDGAAGFASLAKLEADLGGAPQAVAVCESGRPDGGRHYFMQPAGKKARAGGKTAPDGLDVKGSGGYAVGAPSRHISGSRYRFVDGRQYGTVSGDVPWDRVYAYLEANAPKPKAKQPPAASFSQPGSVGNGDDNAFGRAVLDRILDEMRSATSGHRWDTFATDCIFDLARAIHGGALKRGPAEAELADAARSVGMAESEVGRLEELLDAALAKPITDPIAPKPRDDQPRKFTEQESKETPWEPPDSLDLKVPAFPTDALGWMQPHVERLADELQTPIDIVAMMLLATVAATVRGRATIEITPGWVEPLNLYVAVVAGAGETKSPALSVVSRPLRDIEARLLAEAKPEVDANEQRRRIQKSRLDAAERAAAKATTDRFSKEADAVEERRLYDEIPEKTLPRLLAADSTPEGLVQLMAQQGGVIAVLSAEGGMFDTFAGGRYSGGMANLDAVLQAHDGREPIIVDRKGSPPIRVERPCLTLGLAIQPQVLASVGQSEAAVGRGFLARFLFSVPETRVGSRRVTRPVADADHSAFRALIEGIDTLLGGSSVNFVNASSIAEIRVSSSSLDLFYDYRESLEPRRHPRTGDLAGVRAWANKLDGQIARLAGLLQLIYLAEHRQNRQNPIEVDVVALSGALELADYLIGHAVAAHLLLRGDALAASDTALQLLGWIRKNGIGEFTVRDAHRALSGRTDFQRAEAVKDAALVLVQHGYLRALAPDAGPGRNSEKYAVNPLEPT